MISKDIERSPLKANGKQQEDISSSSENDTKLHRIGRVGKQHTLYEHEVHILVSDTNTDDSLTF